MKTFAALKQLFTIAAVVICGAPILVQALPKVPPKWEKLRSDLEYLTINPAEESLLSHELVFLKFEPSKYNVAAAHFPELKGAKAICEESSAAVCINANFFDENYKALGLVINNGKTLNPLHEGGSLLNGILRADKSKIKIVPRRDFAPSGALTAVQAGPLLLLNGKPFSKLRNAAKESRRAGVCIDTSDKLILFSSTGDYSGPSLAELTTILRRSPINCRDALNFDGGGSAQLYVNGEKLNLSREINVSGQYAIPVAIILTTK